jgi:hypothetical protein
MITTMQPDRQGSCPAPNADYERRRCAADSAYIRAPIVRFRARDR